MYVCVGGSGSGFGVVAVVAGSRNWGTNGYMNSLRWHSI